MTTNEHGVRTLRPLAALLLAMVLAGCDNGMSISEIEAKERASRLYTTAMEDLQAGRTDPAIRGFEQVLVQEPRNYLAHFQLATLLQDIKKDYIGAISHYKSYLLFRPTSDKATIASDRMRVCDTLLSAEYLRKAGGKATEKLSDENAKIAGEAKMLREQVKKLEGQLAQAQAQVDRLSEENGRYRRQIGGLGADAETGGSRKHLTKSALAELKDMEGERQRRRLRPTDAELLDDDAPPEDRARIAAELKREKEALKAKAVGHSIPSGTRMDRRSRQAVPRRTSCSKGTRSRRYRDASTARRPSGGPSARRTRPSYRLTDV